MIRKWYICDKLSQSARVRLKLKTCGTPLHAWNDSFCQPELRRSIGTFGVICLSLCVNECVAIGCFGGRELSPTPFHLHPAAKWHRGGNAGRLGITAQRWTVCTQLQRKEAVSLAITGGRVSWVIHHTLQIQSLLSKLYLHCWPQGIMFYSETPFELIDSTLDGDSCAGLNPLALPSPCNLLSYFDWVLCCGNFKGLVCLFNPTYKHNQLAPCALWTQEW